MLMKKLLLLFASAAAVTTAAAGPLDNYDPIIPFPSISIENCTKWMVEEKNTTGDQAVKTKFTYTKEGYPVGTETLNLVDGSWQTTATAELFTWNDMGLCVRYSNYPYMDRTYTYDQYGRVTSRVETSYANFNGEYQIGRVVRNFLDYDETGRQTLYETKSESYNKGVLKSVSGTKWIETREESADKPGTLHLVKTYYSWNQNAGEWVGRTKSERFIETPGEGEMRNISIGYSWDAAANVWKPTSRIVYATNQNLLPSGLDLEFTVENKTYSLKADGTDDYLSAETTMDIVEKDGLYELTSVIKGYERDEQGVVILRSKTDMLRQFEPYLGKDGQKQFRSKLVTEERQMLDPAGKFYVNFTSRREQSAEWSHNETASYHPDGTVASRSKTELRFDNLGRTIFHENFSANGAEDLLPREKNERSYFGESNSPAVVKIYQQDFTTQELVHCSTVSYEYDPTVSPAEVMCLASSISNPGEFMLTRMEVFNPQTNETEVSEYTYRDRSEMVGVENVAVDAADADAPVEVFTVSGQKLGTFPSLEASGLPSGLYITRQGSTTRKIIL